MISLWVLHGPNLNMLGVREPDVYGTTSLVDLDAMLHSRGAAMGAEVTCLQSNHEGALVEWVHGAVAQGVSAIVINPAGLTHTSVSLRDALAIFQGVKIEVHLSNIWQREDFRARSLVAPVVDGVVAGLGTESYTLGLQAAVKLVRRRDGGHAT
ncbi:MAG: type II 3-dehydroquinate dehydratase [Candidatus Sericytochromatia bacterium]|nr:type II 3-dehydroquinate dehydratase [Candidatus Sericytochromatia bacterium]